MRMVPPCILNILKTKPTTKNKTVIPKRNSVTFVFIIYVLHFPLKILFNRLDHFCGDVFFSNAFNPFQAR